MAVGEDVRLESLREFALELGAVDARLVDPQLVVVDERVVWKCRYGCPGYGYFPVCPPATIPPDEFSRNVKKYRWGLLVKTEPAKINEVVVAVEKKALSLGFHLSFGLKGGPCTLCEECVPPGERCRRPDLARPSLEGVGVDVFRTLESLGIEEEMKSPDEDYHFYGLVLIC